MGLGAEPEPLHLGRRVLKSGLGLDERQSLPGRALHDQAFGALQGVGVAVLAGLLGLREHDAVIGAVFL